MGQNQNESCHGEINGWPYPGVCRKGKQFFGRSKATNLKQERFTKPPVITNLSWGLWYISFCLQTIGWIEWFVWVRQKSEININPLWVNTDDFRDKFLLYNINQIKLFYRKNMELIKKQKGHNSLLWLEANLTRPKYWSKIRLQGCQTDGETFFV